MFASIDWPNWQPHETATLLFIRQGDEVLLIRKKRGLGAGKINAPGGRLNPGETPLAAAVREVEEEVGLTPLEITPHGELRFEFVDGYRLLAHVFVARGHRGELVETDEALPFWCKLTALPYAEMWADDALWLPLVLAGRRIDGRFLFDGERMLGYALDSA